MQTPLHIRKATTWLALCRAFLSCLFISIYSYTSFAQGPPQAWLKLFGGDQKETISSWVVTTDGGHLIGGTSKSGISGNKTTAGKGGDDYWIVKTDAAGNKVWDKTFGGSGNDVLKTILVTNDGGYLLSGTSGSPLSGDKSQASKGQKDFWIVRITSAGVKSWDKSYGSALDDVLADVVTNTDGSFVLAGTSNSRAGGDKTDNPRTNPASPAIPPTDYWVIKVNAVGTKVWDETYGGLGNTDPDYKLGYDDLAAIEKTPDGGYLLAGHSNSNTGSQKSEAAKDDGNNPYVTHSDYWIVKINGTGVKVWDKTVGGNEADKLSDITGTNVANQYLLTGVSRSGNTANKVTSPVMSSDEAEHVWTVKITDGTTSGTLVSGSQKFGVARPNTRNYFDNVSVTGDAGFYYLFLNAHDKDGITKRMDKYSWAGTKQWSKYLSDTSHYQSSRLQYQVLNTTFDSTKLSSQVNALYTSFKNGYDAKVFSPPIDNDLYSEGYPDKIDLYGIRGIKNYHNFVISFMEEGISDPKLVQIIYELINPVRTRFETSNQLWPSGKPLPGASNSSNIVKDEWASDYNQTYNHNSTNVKSAAQRRKAWAGSGVTSGSWGMSPTTEERKSPSYKVWPNTGRRKLLYMNENSEGAGIRKYGTIEHPLEVLLSAQNIFWAGYILDINRHLNPAYGVAADDIWNYKINDWEPEITEVLGGRHPTYKFFDFSTGTDLHSMDLHHANDAHASMYYVNTLWHKHRQGAARADDETALKYLMQTILDDIYLINIPSGAPESEKYVGKKIANYSHHNQALRTLMGLTKAYNPGDITYDRERAGTLLTFWRGKVEGISGNTLTDTHLEALSNMHALIVEQGMPASGQLYVMPNDICGYNYTGGSSQQPTALFNNGVQGTGFEYGGSGSPDMLDKGDGGPQFGAIGAFYLSWDRTGRHISRWQTRGKFNGHISHQFDAAVVLNDPNNTMKQAWEWHAGSILLKLRRPEVDISDPLGLPLALTDEANKGYAGVSGQEVVALTTQAVSATNTDYTVTKYGSVYSGTLEAEDAVLSGATVPTPAYSGYTGTGYVDYVNSTGDYIQWTINAPVAGSTYLKFRYTSGGTGNRPLELRINGVVVGTSLPFASTGSWAIFALQTATVNLLAGNNTIRLTTVGTQGPDMDNLAYEVLQTGTLEAELATLSGPTVQSSLGGFTGTGYADYANATGDYVQWTVNKANASNVNLAFRYANGGTTNRSLELRVNGVVISGPSLLFVPSGSWTTWDAQNVTVSLNAGNNTIRLSTIGTHGPNMDNLSFTSSASANSIMAAPGYVEQITFASDQSRAIEEGSPALQAFAFPNPASGSVKLRVTNASTASMDIRVVNMRGEVAKKLKHIAYGKNTELEIPIQDLAAGLYIITVKQGNTVAQAKLVVR